MENPFEIIIKRLDVIESLIIDLKKRQQPFSTQKTEQLLNVQEAAQFLNLTVPTIYSKVSKRELPVMKRSKRLYFSSTELMGYLKQGRKKSYAEIEAEANTYLSNNNKVC